MANRSDRADEIQHTVNINARQGLNELSKLQIEYEELTKHIDKLAVKLQKQEILLTKAAPGSARETKAKKAIEELNKQLDANIIKQNAVNKSIAELTTQTDLTSLSKTQLRRQLKYLEDQYSRLIPSQEGYIESQERLRQKAAEVNEELQKRGQLVEKDKASWLESLKDSMPSAFIGGIAGAAVEQVGEVLAGVLSGIGQKIGQMAEKSDKLADLQLAFQTTAENAKAIDKELASIDTRTTPQKLREIATAGGLLNVPQEEIRDFTDEVNKAVVVMSDDFPGGVEEVTTKLGKLKNVYAETKEMKWGEAVRRDASAIKALADDGTATASFLTTFAQTMSQLPAVLRPSKTEVLGLGAAMEEAGMDAGTAATNLTKVLSVSANNVDKVAAFFGKTKKEIKELINTKPNEFLLEMATRLNKLNATDLAATLNKLKLSDTQTMEVLGVLGEQIDNVRSKQEAASKSFWEGSRILDSYNVKNETFGANLEKLSNNFNRWWGNSAMSKGFSKIAMDIVNGLGILFKAEEDLNTKFNQQTENVKNLDKNLSPLLAKYDELSKNKSAENQAELRKVMSQIVSIMPDASYQVDQYGRVLSINTTKTREFIEQQRAMLQVINKDLLDKTFKENVALQKKREELITEFRRVNALPRNGQGKPYEQIATGVSYDGVTTFKTVIYDVKTLQKEIDVTNAKVRSTGLAWYGLRGELKSGSGTTQTTTTNDGKGDTGAGVDDEESKKQKQLAEERIENARKVSEEIYRMNIESITDESDKKKAQLEADLAFESDRRAGLVQQNKMNQSDYDLWLKAASQKLDDDIAKIDSDALAKKEKAEMDSAREVAVIVLQTRLELAEASGDEEAVLAAKIALRKGEFEIEIEKATADKKQAIYEKYLADVGKLTADHAKKKNDAQAKSDLAYFEEYTKMSAENYEKAKKQKLDAEKEQRKALGEFAKASEDAIFSILSSRLEDENTAINNQYAREFDALEKQKEQKLISDEDYAARKEVLEKEQNKKLAEVKRKQAIYDKAQALIQVAINTALAVSKVLAQTGILAPATIPLIIGAGAVEAIAIASKPLPEVPSFDQGGATDGKKKYVSAPMFDVMRAAGGGEGLNFPYAIEPDRGGETNVFDRRLPANDGKDGFVSILHKDEYVVNSKVRNTKYWANIEPIVEGMRTGKIRSFEEGGSRTPTPTFSAPTTTAPASPESAAPVQYVVQFPEEMLNWFVSAQSSLESGLNLTFMQQAEFLEQLQKIQQKHANSLITKKPNP
ncbi:phage tail tape measure protein [Emticicia fontis]